MALKLPRTIRLDASDTFVYRRAAAPGEWAVTGTFLFLGMDAATLTGKAKQAFRGGFLGIDSFGWSTLVVVTEASAAERTAAIDLLARRLVERCGAPDIAAALAASEEEVAFAESLCDLPPNTVVGLHRSVEGDLIRERFRTLRRRPDWPAQDAFRFVVEEEDGRVRDGVDLLRLAGEAKG